MNNVIGKILVRLGLDSSEFKRGTQDAERQTQDFTGKIGGMFKRIAGFAVAGAVLKKAFSFGKEAYAAAAAAEGVKIAFDRLNDPNLLNNLKSATKGTVDELKLMQLSVQAKNFKLPVEQLSTYLQFATKRAQETGMSVDYLTNSIITGLGRKSVLILDNLGISAAEIREEMAKGGEMADAVGRIIQREMAKAGEITDTSAIKTERLSASWSNLVGTIGDTSVIKSAGNAIVDTLTYISDAMAALVKSENLSAWQKFLGFLGHGGYQGDALVEQSWKSWKDKNANERAQKWTDRIAGSAKGNNDNAENLLAWANLIRKGQGGGLYDELGGLTGEEIKQVQELTAKKLESLAADKKNAAQQKIYREQSIAGIKGQIDELQKLADAETDPKKKTEYASQLRILNAKLEKEQSLYDFSKKTFAADEAENTSKLKSLKSQEKQYGNSILYQEELLSLMREKEKFAKSNEEYQKIKAENDELEKQIKLRKSDYQKNSEVDLKGQLSDAETEMPKLDTTTEAGKQRMGELLTVVKNLKWQIENLPQNLPTTERGRIDKQIEDLKRLQSEISIDDGSVGAVAKAQTVFNQLQAQIDALENKKLSFPKIEFADGSVAAYQQQIADIDKTINTLTGSELAAAQAARALLEVQKKGAESGWQTELEQETRYLNLLKKALEEATEAQKQYAQEAVDAQQVVVDNLDDSKKTIQQFNDDVSAALEAGATAGIVALGTAIGELAMGQNGGDVWAILLAPIADMAVQLGELAIATGVAMLGIEAAFKSMNPYAAIAAGVALVALGTIVKGAISNMSSKGPSSTGGNNNTFTGGYSSGGMYSSNAKSASYISQQSPQVVVLETKVKGSDLLLVQSNEQNRRKR